MNTKIKADSYVPINIEYIYKRMHYKVSPAHVVKNNV